MASDTGAVMLILGSTMEGHPENAGVRCLLPGGSNCERPFECVHFVDPGNP